MVEYGFLLGNREKWLHRNDAYRHNSSLMLIFHYIMESVRKFGPDEYRKLLNMGSLISNLSELTKLHSGFFSSKRKVFCTVQPRSFCRFGEHEIRGMRRT
ncbi:hypothetical protein ACOME3_008408 [Neoechinorhynchus agilis]